ncbi:MAG: 1,4-alpha-glucan branching enzyme, partial [Flavobacterium sp.]
MSTVITHSLFTDFDIDLFKAGKHFRLYEKLGAHLTTIDGVAGVYFAVWAPSARQVSVIGDFNFWNKGEHALSVRWDSSGIWEGFIPGVQKGTAYKYFIESNNGGVVAEKADPFAFYCEHPPRTASIVWDLEHKWNDSNWIK